MNVARMTVMHIILILVVLVFAAPLILYASPLILYVAPLIAVGFLISWVTDAVRHKSRAVGH
jgi:hypothetical protein